MVKNTKHLLVGFFFAILFGSCSEYQKALKNEDVKVKYDLAEKLYNEGNYKKALRLFEQVVPNYVGKPQGERILFFYANSYYQTKDYYLASYQFERFVKSYPRSEKAVEAAFLGAKSQYKVSPRYNIDQKETHKALGILQNFINTHQDSEYLPEANEMAKDLRDKLDKKAFEIAKQYNTIQDYKAAIKAFDLFLSDSPGSVYREDALYYKFLAHYSLAVNSVRSLMEERLNDTKIAYGSLKKYFPDSKYNADAEKMIKTIDKELQQFSK